MRKSENHELICVVQYPGFPATFHLFYNSVLPWLDLAGDGDNRLVIADLGSGNFNMKLRVFRGTQQVLL